MFGLGDGHRYAEFDIRCANGNNQAYARAYMAGGWADDGSAVSGLTSPSAGAEGRVPTATPSAGIRRQAAIHAAPNGAGRSPPAPAVGCADCRRLPPSSRLRRERRITRPRTARARALASAPPTSIKKARRLAPSGWGTGLGNGFSGRCARYRVSR